MLSNTKIKNLKPAEKMFRILDSERLYIEVRPSGKKIWRFKYSFESKETSMSLGEYPLISLKEARERRQLQQKYLSQGLNPVAEKRKSENKAKSSTLFKFVAQEYKEKKLKTKSHTYILQYDRAMQKDIFPIIGDKEVSEVTSADVLEIMEKTVKRIRRSKSFTGEVAAILNRKFIGAIIRYAIVTLRANYDPTYAVKDYVERPEIEHARVLTKQEMFKLRTSLDSYKGSSTVKNAGLALLYSMLRTVEVRRMKWSFVDFDECFITFPVMSRRKTQERSTKKNRLHLVPISNQLYQLLKEQYEITGHQDYVFCSIQRSNAMLSATTLNRMLEYIDLKGVTAHDFRATASTVLNEKGYSEDWIEKQLAHSHQNKTRASYNHAQYLNDRRKMLQDWADMVDGWKQ